MDMQSIRAAFGERILSLRDAAHRCPERGMEERETTRLLRMAMEPLGLTELPLGLPTGCAFRLTTGKNGPVVGLRADVDGLPVEEPEGAKNRSQRAGFMHACGHDVHMAGLYGAALALCSVRDTLPGDVVFLFQPAEETVAGARRVIEHGLFDRAPVGCMFGLHNMPELPVGTVGVRQGALMAAKDAFSLTIHGRGGHGAMPETCRDPIVAAAAVVTALQTVVSRSIGPLESAAVSVCSIHGGSTDNRIEDEVTMLGSVRTLDPGTRRRLLSRMEEIATQCAAAYGCTAALTILMGVPSVVNAESLTDAATRAALATVRKERVVVAEPVMISEDFACYGERMPAFFYLLGSGFPGRENAPLHSAGFLAHDDTALYAAALLTNAVLAAQNA